MIDDPNWPMEHEATFGEGNQPSDRGVIRFVCQTRIAAGADQYCRTNVTSHMMSCDFSSMEQCLATGFPGPSR
jgi:hypothetical protein